MRYFKTNKPMRADQIAYEIYKDVKFTKDLIRVNPLLKEVLIIPENTIVFIPEVNKNSSLDKGINLWS